MTMEAGTGQECGEDDGKESAMLHVFDLPQLYQRPDAEKLRAALSLLVVDRTGFDTAPSRVHDEGVTAYLTKIVASPLAWIEAEEDREALWTSASQSLAQRSGRSGMGDVTRTFTIPLSSGSAVDVCLHEPAMTEDNLGLKTWGSSFVLAKRLESMHIPALDRSGHDETSVLELGAGTGLVGLAAAVVWGKTVVLTDLLQIEPNLSKNITINAALIEEHSGAAVGGVLDWQSPRELRVSAPDFCAPAHFDIILAADPIYSPDHPKMLVDTIMVWLSPRQDARVIIAYPLRDAYAPQIGSLHDLMGSATLVLEASWEEMGQDDWSHDVSNVCTVWKWTE